jgi:hypothetical protein
VIISERMYSDPRPNEINNTTSLTTGRSAPFPSFRMCHFSSRQSTTLFCAIWSVIGERHSQWNV